MRVITCINIGTCSSTKQTIVNQDNENENVPVANIADNLERAKEEFERKYA